MKTFWDWQDQQLPDGTIIWRFPDGQTYVGIPGSALLFPHLCAPTGDPPTVETPAKERCGERTAMMPLRTTTRAQTGLIASPPNAATTATPAPPGAPSGSSTSAPPTRRRRRTPPF
jgi:hypothetical protein